MEIGRAEEGKERRGQRKGDVKMQKGLKLSQKVNEYIRKKKGKKGRKGRRE